MCAGCPVLLTSAVSVERVLPVSVNLGACSMCPNHQLYGMSIRRWDGISN
jgi:hypothetical protein